MNSSVYVEPLASFVYPEKFKCVVMWEARPLIMALRECASQQNPNVTIRNGPVSVSISFTYARPKKHYRTTRSKLGQRLLAKGAASSYPPTGYVDQMIRIVIQALVGLVIHDETQVVKIAANKRYGGGNAVQVAVHKVVS